MQRHSRPSSLRAASTERASDLVSGGNVATYLVIRPAATVSATIDVDGLRLTGTIREMTIEALRYRNELAYVFEAPPSEE